MESACLYLKTITLFFFSVQNWLCSLLLNCAGDLDKNWKKGKKIKWKHLVESSSLVGLTYILNTALNSS